MESGAFMIRICGLAFVLTGFVLVHIVFAYLVFWLAGLMFDQTISSTARLNTGIAISVDLLLVTVFGFQHSVMARNAFKSFISPIVPLGLERATYVWCSVLALFLLVHLYQPVPITLWSFENAVALIVIWTLFVIGWSIAAAAYLSIGMYYLLGVSQALAWYRDEPQPPVPLVNGYAYKVVRNPQQLGLLIAFWSTPHMTVGHLIFAIAMSTYIIVGMTLEEQDLAARHGASYVTYKKQVPLLIPRIIPRRNR